MSFYDAAGSVEKEYWYCQNARGDVVALTNEAGDTVLRLQYSAYGEVFEVGDDGELKAFDKAELVGYGFQGLKLDAETGLYYARNRYYSSAQGRWLSRDPLGYGGGGMGLYEAFASNPISFSDSLGLQNTQERFDLLILPIYAIELYDKYHLQKYGEEFVEKMVKEANEVLKQAGIEIQIIGHDRPSKEKTEELLTFDDIWEGETWQHTVTQVPCYEYGVEEAHDIVKNLYTTWFDRWTTENREEEPPILVVFGTSKGYYSSAYGSYKMPSSPSDDFQEQIAIADNRFFEKGMVILRDEPGYSEMTGKDLAHELVHILLRKTGHYRGEYLLSWNSSPTATKISPEDIQIMRQYVEKRFGSVSRQKQN